MSGRKRVAIVGGGIAGLAAAYDLARSVREEGLPIECRLFESSGSFGGVIRTERADGFLLDLGPDALFRGKPAAAQLARAIGLEGELISALPQRSPALIYSRGRLYPLPEGLELVAPTRILPFMASRLISPAGKLRMMLEPFIPARRDGEDESIARFIRRRFGEQALERMAGPLLAGIHAGDPERLSIRSTFPRLPDLEQEHGSIAQAMRVLRSRRGAAQAGHARPAAVGPPFLAFRSGMRIFIERLAERVEPAGLQAGCRVERIERAPEGYRLHLEGGATWEADSCVVAVPGAAAASMLEEMSAELARRLEQVRYVSTAAVFLGYREGPEVRIPPSSGFLIAVAERRGIFGATFASNKFEGRAPEGRLLVRAFVGGALDEPAAEQPDETMIASTREALAGTIGLRAEPEFIRVQRWPKANPQYEVGHGRIVAAVDAALAELPGLFVTGSALRGVGVPDGVKLGREAAARVREFLVAA